MLMAGGAYQGANLVDWRFLLPAVPAGGFQHLLLAGGTPQHEETALIHGVAQRVSSTPRPGDAFDAIVVLAGASADGATLTRHLVAGGTMYWEVDRRVRGAHALTPRRAISRLRRDGVTPVATYWVKPWFPARHMYLPLDAPEAFRWYVDSLCGSRTRSRRLLKAAVRAYIACDGPLAACAPCYAVVGTRGTAVPAALLAQARALGACEAGVLRPVMLAHGGLPWNRMAMLLFTPGDSTPRYVIKSSRTTTFNASVEWEHRVLRELASTLPPSLRRSIPASALFYWNGLAVAVESCVQGSSLSSRIGASADIVLDDLRLAFGWLGSFHTETSSERTPARAWLARHLVEGLFAEYAATLSLAAAESSLFSAVARSLSSLDGLTLPIGWHHTDFVPWNAYRDGDELRVIDWEVARRGLAAADVFKYLLHWDAELHRHAHQRPDIDRVLAYLCGAAPFPLGDECRQIVDAYLDRVGVDAALLPYVLVYALTEQAVEQARRLRDSNCTVRPERIPEVAYLRVMGEQTTRWFGMEERHAA
jgi:hypothetical protein